MSVHVIAGCTTVSTGGNADVGWHWRRCLWREEFELVDSTEPRGGDWRSSAEPECLLVVTVVLVMIVGGCPHNIT